MKLVGTVVADNAQLNRVFIDNRKTRSQKAYYEGDKAGDVVIKKGLRNKVIVGTDTGDKLLTVEIQETRQASIISSAAQPAVSDAAAATPTTASTMSRARTRTISLDREDVEATLKIVAPSLYL